MKVVIVDTYYPRFLEESYRQGTAGGYHEQRRRLIDACFGTSDFYSRHLKKLGVDAEEIIANCAPLQLAWAREHGFRALPVVGNLPESVARWPVTARVLTAARALIPIVVEQVERARPDVLYNQDPTLLPPDALARIKKTVKLLVGQIASPLPPPEYLAPYDLILTSFPHWVPRFAEQGIAAEYFPLGFEASILDRVGSRPRRHACTFVGGISPNHQRGLSLLEHLAKNADVDFFGYGAGALAADSPIRAPHHGEVWALDMYRVLAESAITINRHIDLAEGFANNMRLYEATGMGAMLLTDAKANLGEIFEVGKEVVAYESPEEAVELIHYYGEHPDERDAIARAGQDRTLRDHTYERRMEQLAGILQRRL